MSNPWEKLPPDFYLRDTVEVAKDLIGRYLIREVPGGRLACRITETEAYCGPEDPACHSYRRKAPKGRTNIMYRAGGLAYIYLIYGMYCCLNFVTEPEGEPAAVLIRGLSPRYNQDIIAENRFHCKCRDMTAYQKRNFLNGPGKVCAGMNIGRTLNGLPYGSEELFLCARPEDAGLPPCPQDSGPLDIQAGKRIGIDYAEEAVHFPWRFYL